MSEAPEILLDTNLIVLLCVGLTSESLIAKHKKTRAFTTTDFALLVGILGRTPIVILPNVASETSNLLSFHREPERGKVHDTFAALIEHYLEIFVPSREAVRESEYRRLGLTDVAILSAAKDRQIITTDTMLHKAAETRRLKTINFNYLRNFS